MGIKEAFNSILDNPSNIFTVVSEQGKDLGYLVNVGGQLQLWQFGIFGEYLVFSDKYMRATYTLFTGKFK